MEDLVGKLVSESERRWWEYSRMVVSAQSWASRLTVGAAVLSALVALIEAIDAAREPDTITLISLAVSALVSLVLLLSDKWSMAETAGQARETCAKMIAIRRALELQLALPVELRADPRTFLAEMDSDYSGALQGAPPLYSFIEKASELRRAQTRAAPGARSLPTEYEISAQIFGVASAAPAAPPNSGPNRLISVRID